MIPEMYTRSVTLDDLKPSTGWEQQRSPYKAKFVTSQMEFSQFEQHVPKSIDEVKERLVWELVKNLYNSNNIEFQEDHNIRNMRTTYKARLNIVDKEFKEVIYEGDRTFKVQDEYFNNKEIEEAIKVAFPERFV